VDKFCDEQATETGRKSAVQGTVRPVHTGDKLES